MRRTGSIRKERSVVQVLVSMMIGNAVVAAALALAALAAMKLRRPAAAHVLWLLVILKLLTPGGWRVAVIEEPRHEAIIMPAATTHVTAAAVQHEAAPAMLPPAWAPAGHAVATPTAPAIASPARTSTINIAQVLIAIWLTGSLAWIATTVTRIFRFRRLLRDANKPSDDLLDEVRTMAARMHVERPPELRLIDAAVSPMLFFAGRRVQLVLPRELIDRTSPAEREGVIAHELAHLKRGDHWVRLFEMLATAVLWWHPLLWLARRGLREAEEQCCDAWVVALLPDARRRYADALVDALELVAGRSIAAPAGATGLGKIKTKNLRRRLTMILTGRSPKSLSKLGKIVLALIALGMIPLVPMRGPAPQSGSVTPLASSSSGAFAATTAAATTQQAGADEATRRAVDALLERAVQDSDQNVRNAALTAIGRFGPRAIPALLDGVRDERTAEFSRNLLAGLGLESMDALVAALESSDPQVRKEALRTLAQIVNRIYTSRPEYAGVAQAAGMGGFGGGYGGTYAAGSPAAFRPGLPGEMEAAAPAAVGPPEVGGEPGGAAMSDPLSRLFAPVTKAARDENREVRREALQLMSHLMILAVPPGRTGELMPALQTAMGDPDVEVRADAMQALLYAGPAAAGATPALARAVGDSNDRVRSAALMALRAIGPAARDATPAVIAALKDPQPPIRALAAEALGALQAPPPAPAAGPEGIESGAIPPVDVPAPAPPVAPPAGR